MDERGYDAGDRLLFRIADATGVSIDRLYSFGVLRLAMMLARMGSSIFDKSPR